MRFLSKILLSLYTLVHLGSMFLPLAVPQASAESLNLISNPSAETAAASLPKDWSKDNWGANKPVFTYQSTGHTGSRSLKVQLTSRTDGDAKWAFKPVAVTANTQYDYSDYYTSTVQTHVVAELDNGSGNYTYIDMAAAPVATAWTQYKATLKTAADTKSVTVYHVVAAVGSLTTDDFSLALTGSTEPTTPPQSGTNLVANPSFETAGSPATTPANWIKGGWGTNVSGYTYPVAGHTGSRAAKVAITSYTSGDIKWYFTPVAVAPNTTYEYSDYYQSTAATSVIAQLDDGSGNYTYEFIADAPASSAWKQYKGTFKTAAATKSISIFHIISTTGSLTLDDVSFAAAATSTAPTAPLVNVTGPTVGSTVSGTTTLSAAATAQGNNPVSSVQFKVDGQNAGAADTSAPYTQALNTTGLANGAHSVTATATAANGQTTTSAAVAFTVANTVVSPTNLISNPSLETAASSAVPAGWYQGAWGSNITTFTYQNSGHTGSRSVRIDTSNYVDGGANWTYDAPSVTGGKEYVFSEYYQSNGATQVIVAVKLADGTTQYLWLGNPYTSVGTWTKFSATFTMPLNAVTATAYHGIVGNGYLVTDDYDFHPYQLVGFDQAMVSITFDDGLVSQYQNALPVLNQYSMKGTFYIVSGLVNTCDGALCYMSPAQVQNLHATGHEIGSHTVDHSDLTSLTPSQVTDQLAGSKTSLQQLIGAPVTDFASPYGKVNAAVLAEVRNQYSSHRGVQLGYNSIDNYDPMNLMIQDINSSTTVAQVKSYIDHAKATHTWLILMYHDINPDMNADPGYDTTPADFAAHMAYLKASGIAVVTMQQGLQAAAAQTH